MEIFIYFLLWKWKEIKCIYKNTENKSSEGSYVSCENELGLGLGSVAYQAPLSMGFSRQ